MTIKKKGDDCPFYNSPDCYKMPQNARKNIFKDKGQTLMESGVLSRLAEEFSNKLRHFIPEIERVRLSREKTRAFSACDDSC